MYLPNRTHKYNSQFSGGCGCMLQGERVVVVIENHSIHLVVESQSFQLFAVVILYSVEIKLPLKF